MSSTGLLSSFFQYNPTCSTTKITDDYDSYVFPSHTTASHQSTNNQNLSEARLAERTRIARELHDTLLQGFFAVSMYMHDAVDYLPPDFAEKSKFDNALKMMDKVLEEGRSVVMDLRAQCIQIESLAEAFASIPGNLDLPASAEFRVSIRGRETRLETELTHEIYRIASEAITNACRHSQATVIEVEVEYRPKELRVMVRDNGCGMDLHRLQWGRDGHWGLLGMSERAEAIGASLRVWSRPSLGTEVELCVSPGLEKDKRTIQARIEIDEREVA